MATSGLSRVTLYRLTSATTGPADLKLKKYDLVKSGLHALAKKPFQYWLYFLNSKPVSPPWFGTFQPQNLTMPNGTPVTQVAGFVMLVQLNTAFYALTGGIGHVALRAENEVEPRFGAILAEKLLSLPELRGLVQKDTSGTVFRLDRVFRGGYNPRGEVDNLRRILTSIRGSLLKTNKMYAIIGRSIQAGDALTVNGRKSFDALFTFIAAVENLWHKSGRQIEIPQLEHIDATTHASLVDELRAALIRSLAKFKQSGDTSLFLDGSDHRCLVDLATSFSLRHGTQTQLLDAYPEVLERAGDILRAQPDASSRMAAFQKMKLEVELDDGSKQRGLLSDFLCGDVSYKKEAYFLSNRRWYRANAGFLAQIDREIDNITCVQAADMKLVPWDVAKYNGKKGEFRFNDACCSKHDHLLMDCRTVKLPGEKGPIEFCDILSKNGNVVNLIHVKRENGAGLRALFAQGHVSASLYREDSFRKLVHDGTLNGIENLQKHEQDAIKTELANLAQRQRREFRVVFAIFDDTAANAPVPGAKTTSEWFRGTLTPFAKVDLLDRAQSIRAMGYNDVVVVRIAPK